MKSIKEKTMQSEKNKLEEAALKLYKLGWTIDETARTLNIEKKIIENYIKENDTKDALTIPHIISYSIDELAQMVEQPDYKYVNLIDGNPVHKICDIKPLPGEVFRKYPENGTVEVSNLGRIKIKDKIIEQKEDHPDGKDYLYINIGRFTEERFVYRLVAKTWCKKPWCIDVSQKWHVHHISNNGYDNRPSNLMWVTEAQHKKMHPRHHES